MNLTFCRRFLWRRISTQLGASVKLKVAIEQNLGENSNLANNNFVITLNFSTRTSRLVGLKCSFSVP